jgi:hypothetical protein
MTKDDEKNNLIIRLQTEFSPIKFKFTIDEEGDSIFKWKDTNNQNLRLGISCVKNTLNG